MKKAWMFLALTTMVAGNSYAAGLDTTVYVRNTHASYVNGGMCSLAFDVTANDSIENLENIEFTVTMQDKAGKIIARDVVTADEFNFVGGKSYGGFFIEGEEACNAFGETLLISKAIVNYNDGRKSEDIVKSKKLKFDDFKAMKIVIK
ncbi:IrmA family protein [Acinetobacter rudis]|uniref:Uncharacterized protein n=1 Tax=Acinetobacter rudis CIP 110305 TaxID=421052 RepID=S3NMQ5_9GAMM|nr:IrmA family protein [Acinetobacter rudis]EPF75574.1 hypothetical protein F945_01239 [Acinetobacter rudis CIP 110305]